MANQNTLSRAVAIESITQPEDFGPFFDVCAKAFGTQTSDGIWTGANPGWNTPDGKSQGAARLAARWHATKDANNTHFLKASSIIEGAPQIVGVAIWVNASLVPGCGDIPDPLDFSSLYPDNEREQRYITQVIGSMQTRRRQVLEEKCSAASAQKSVMVLDLCASDPDFQRRGIASKLVNWGLDEAVRLGGIEAITEASVMGRTVYKRLGFTEIEEIQYEVDEEFENRERPSNVFLRTRP
ncbi:hypothetical protein BP6252_03975 [Coleophoma cylindrospora]|uniref:N-acetyltransferase domain-containing protein n=1 Tax=Coleophoma cylindrospora TaxID=1849047 RepID=A0A3D8S9A3_9HELO|nr:hypothetical protein BP6252_03975 [Coleophoma cylindrospora]